MYTRPTYAEIDLSAVRHNIQLIRERIGEKVKIMPAVKADAYGHGAVEVSRTVLEAGANALGVACVEEGAELREAGIDAPILILGCSTKEAIPDIVHYRLTSTICDFEFPVMLSAEAVRQKRTASVHIKVDTGMGRIGVSPDKAKELAAKISGLDGLFLEGIFTHFPTSDCADGSFTKQQIADFSSLISEIEKEGIHIPLRHAANSGAILDHPDAYFNVVRPGIIVYGLHPSNESSRLPLKEVLSLKTAIVHLKEVTPGTTVSYGRTFIANRSTKVATLPIGYADGYNRHLSNRGRAVVRGKVVPVIGRVCMDQIMIDVTDVPGVSMGDEVALYGGMIDESISVEVIAEMLNTIPYEVTCWIGKRVPRVYKR